jgi:pyruvate dehydrogenase E1 component alpha subunit
MEIEVGVTLERATMISHYQTMLTIRFFEERVMALRLDGDIVGSVHLCIGQEAIPAGVVDQLDLSRDVVTATYRGHGWAIACGVPLTELFAELLGRSTGVNGGRAGSALLSDPRRGFLGENSIVGAGAPIACGAALAARVDASMRVAVVSFGDGAMNQGAVLEALNFAAALLLPVIFVCENNEWSELTPLRDMVADDVLVNRATAFGIESRRVDGNAPDAVADVAAIAVDWARSGRGPFFIEAMTQRICGHYIGDPETYRTDSDRADLKAQDPIPRLRASLLASGYTEEELSTLETGVMSEVDVSAAAALSDPLADPGTALEHVHA